VRALMSLSCREEVAALVHFVFGWRFFGLKG
jgi:hypothetical protein